MSQKKRKPIIIRSSTYLLLSLEKKSDTDAYARQTHDTHTKQVQ